MPSPRSHRKLMLGVRIELYRRTRGTSTSALLYLRHPKRRPIAVIRVERDLTHQRERFEVARDEVLARTAESRRDFIDGARRLRNRGADGGELLDGSGRPRPAIVHHRCGGGLPGNERELGRRGTLWCEARDLVVRTEPSNHTAPF